jgi:dienelactone hydrolase
MDALSDFHRDSFSHDSATRTVYRKGTGPGVVVISEVPGITPEVAGFARRVVDEGFTVAMPDLFGKAGKPNSVPYTLDTIARVCVSSEFTMFARGTASPVTEWLRALGRDLHERAGGPGIGAVGMCLTGGFALAMMVEPSMLVPVLSQPSLPFALVPGRAPELGISDADLEVVKRRCEDEDLCVMGLRFTNDRMVPKARFDRLRREFGDRFVAIELDPKDANPNPPIPAPPHSVLTGHLIDEPGQPTYEAREQVMQLFKDRLVVTGG